MPEIAHETAAISEYHTIVADLAGNDIAEIPAGNPIYSEVLNGPGAYSFTLPILNSKATRAILNPGLREIHLYRNDNLVWGGFLNAVNVSSNEKSIRFAAEGYYGRLKKRYIDVTREYIDTEQFDIVWDLINWTQHKTFGNIGIGRMTGEAASGVERTVIYNSWERRFIADVIDEMASLWNGFDFEVTPDKVWKVYYTHKGSTLNDVVFEFGRNIGGLSYDIDTTDLAEEISAIGGGEDSATCIAVTADLDNMALYGRREDTVSNADIKNFSELASEANAELNIKNTPRYQPQVSVFQISDVDYPYGAFHVGDVVRIRGDYGYIDVDDLFRIISVTYAISNEGREAVTVMLDDKVHS